MLQCKICNQEFNSYTGLAGHINLKHHISSKEYYIKYLKQNDEGICPICGKETKWFSLRKGFRKHCSKSCSSADPNVYKIKTETEFKNTGYYNQMENPIHHKKMIELSKLKENQEKRIQSCKDNNGYGTGFQIKSVKEKAEKTIIDKYGVDNVFKLPEIHQIANKTKEEKYNNKNYNNREKCRQTKLERYGDPNYNNLEKLVQTFREKYNVDWYFQTEEFKEKSTLYSTEPDIVDGFINAGNGSKRNSL